MSVGKLELMKLGVHQPSEKLDEREAGLEYCYQSVKLICLLQWAIGCGERRGVRKLPVTNFVRLFVNDVSFGLGTVQSGNATLRMTSYIVMAYRDFGKGCR